MMLKTSLALVTSWLPYLAATAFALAAALALFGMLPYAVIVAAPFGCAWAVSRHDAQRLTKKVDSEARAMADALLLHLQRNVPLANAVGRSLSADFVFSAAAREALLRYLQSGTADAFRSIDAAGSKRLAELFSVIASSLESGSDSRHTLAKLCESFAQEDAYRLRSLGSTGNYSSIIRLGTSVFFPMFAGVSINIMSFAHSSLAGAPPAGSAQLLAIFAVYAVAANYLGTSARAGLKDRLTAAAVFGSIAIMVLKGTAALSGVMA